MSSPEGNPNPSPEGEAETPQQSTRTVILPSPHSSQESSSHLSDLPLENVAAPEWGNEEQAVEFFLQVKKILRRIFYHHLKVLQEAIDIYKENHATHFKNYEKLNNVLNQDCHKWTEFALQKMITVEFLLGSAIYLDLNARRRLFITPKNAMKKTRSLMQDLRGRLTATNNQLTLLQDRVNEAITRLEESQNGHENEPFPEITTMEAIPDPEPVEIVTSPAGGDPVISENDDDTDSEGNEEFLTIRRIRDEADLPKHGLDPVWTSWGGYPGEIPDNIKEFLNDDGTRRK
jgi:hypothetical protein